MPLPSEDIDMAKQKLSMKIQRHGRLHHSQSPSPLRFQSVEGVMHLHTRHDEGSCISIALTWPGTSVGRATRVGIVLLSVAMWESLILFGFPLLMPPDMLAEA